MSRFDLYWPTTFPLEPSGIDLLESADFTYEVERFVPASGEAAIRRLFDGSLGRAVPGLIGMFWHTEPGRLDGAVVDEAFVFMTLRLRTVWHEPGRRIAMSIDRCSLPLGRQMLEVVDCTPEGAGCRVRWRVAVRYWPGMSVGAPLVKPAFFALFRRTLAALAASFEG